MTNYLGSDELGMRCGCSGSYWRTGRCLGEQVFSCLCARVCECVHVLVHWFAARQNPGVQRCSHCLQGLQIFLEEGQSPAP